MAVDTVMACTLVYTMIHSFNQDISQIALPEAFTYPFHYTPHTLSVLASEQVQSYLQSQEQWANILQEGKMFGVLIVKHQNKVGFLAAFSGLLNGENSLPYFVPPVYDLLHPDGFFKKEETEISALNKEIHALEQDDVYIELKARLSEAQTISREEILSKQKQLKIDRARRREIRQQDLSPEEIQALVMESQYQKAELVRLKRLWKERFSQIQTPLQEKELYIQQLKQERKQRSATLQQQLFDQFQMLNAHGTTKGLCTIFADTAQKTPPAGSGECCAPKLLQYAYQNGLKPICMAEFWWGASPKTEIRHHGQYYPSCRGKCLPILGHMLKGLAVEPNPLARSTPKSLGNKLIIEYEDQYLLVVNKPAGLLSVPGKESQQDSVYSIILERYPDSTGPLVVHRLDMDTSGLLLLAKDKETHRLLQALFLERQVEKMYLADIITNDASNLQDDGEIKLPLILDHLDRPRQKVDFEHGKPAHTSYKTLVKNEKIVRISLFPHTGRTHQLRVHMAHQLGVNAPIVGDPLYGQAADRLHLHAARLQFTHPVTKKNIVIESEPDF